MFRRLVAHRRRSDALHLLGVPQGEGVVVPLVNSTALGAKEFRFLAMSTPSAVARLCRPSLQTREKGTMAASKVSAPARTAPSSDVLPRPHDAAYNTVATTPINRTLNDNAWLPPMSISMT